MASEKFTPGKSQPQLVSDKDFSKIETDLSKALGLLDDIKAMLAQHDADIKAEFENLLEGLSGYLISVLQGVVDLQGSVGSVKSDTTAIVNNSLSYFNDLMRAISEIPAGGFSGYSSLQNPVMPAQFKGLPLSANLGFMAMPTRREMVFDVPFASVNDYEAFAYSANVGLFDMTDYKYVDKVNYDLGSVGGVRFMFLVSNTYVHVVFHKS